MGDDWRKQAQSSGATAAIERPNLEVARLPADGRYETRLPFLADTRPKENFLVALKVMERLRSRLESTGDLERYHFF